MGFEMPPAPATDGTRRVADHIAAMNGANIGMPMFGNARYLQIAVVDDDEVAMIVTNNMNNPPTKEYFRINIEQVEAWEENAVAFALAPAEAPVS